MARNAVQLQGDAAWNALFQGYDGPVFSVRLWNGSQWSIAPGRTPVFTLTIATPKALAALASAPNEITLGEAFIHGELEIEGDIFAAFSVVEHLLSRPHGLKHRLMLAALRTAAGAERWLRHGARHSQRRDRASIAYHYDQPVEFFAPWLGETLAYSCAYFRSADDTLDQAQRQKLELICNKLRLQPGERFMDMGCGWGSLVLHAAQAHHAQAHGITLSQGQAGVAQRRVAQAGLNGNCIAELRDYRQCAAFRGSVDKLASVGMYEHVGLKNLQQYFRIARDLLRPGGVFLNHGIARAATAPVRKDSFVERYVFPDGRLVTLTQTIEAAEQAGLEVRDVENLREHYALTLRYWVAGLQRHAAALRQLVPETTYRIWLLYTAGSSAAFARGDLGLYQVLLSRPDHGTSRLPLTREDWYAPRTMAVYS